MFISRMRQKGVRIIALILPLLALSCQARDGKLASLITPPLPSLAPQRPIQFTPAPALSDSLPVTHDAPPTQAESPIVIPSETPSPTVSVPSSATPLPEQTPTPIPTPTPSSSPPVEITNGADRGLSIILASPSVYSYLVHHAQEFSVIAQPSFNEAVATLSVRFDQSPSKPVKLYREREHEYGASDKIAEQMPLSGTRMVTFTINKPGDYKTATAEKYQPPPGALMDDNRISEAEQGYEFNGAQRQSSTLSTRRHIATINTAPWWYLKNFLNLDPYALHPVIVFLHGMGSEYRSGQLFGNLKNALRAAVITYPSLREAVWWTPVYDSRLTIVENKEIIKNKLLRIFGAAPLYFVAHSMGALLARDLAADPALRPNVIGGSLLGGANVGSPFVPQKRMRASILGQPDATAILTAQKLSLAATLPNVLEVAASQKPFNEIVSMLDEGFTSRGALCLASGRADVPVTQTSVWLNTGFFPLPVSETLSDDDRFVLPCQYAPYYGLPESLKRYRNGKCFTNFAHALRWHEENQQLINEARWVVYAGHYRGDELRASRRAFLLKLMRPELLAAFLLKTPTAEEEALQFSGGVMNERVTLGGTPKRLSDGLVDVEDALLLRDGAYIEAYDSRVNDLKVDHGIIRARLPGDVREYHVLLRSHRGIIAGKTDDDPELFGLLIGDIVDAIQRFKERGSTFTSNDSQETLKIIKSQYERRETLWIYDTEYFYEYIVKYPQFNICAGESHCRDIRFTIEKRLYKRVTDGYAWEDRYVGRDPDITGRVMAYRVWESWCVLLP